MAIDSDVLHSERKHILRPVVELTKGLSQDDIEQLVISAVQEYRALLQKAEALFDRVSPCEQGKGTSKPDFEYVEAMIALHGRMATLSTLLDVLGYTPNIP